jgi:membrane fusion protein, multidrug efflux system
LGPRAGTFNEQEDRHRHASTIDNQIDQTTGTLRLRAIFRTTDNASCSPTSSSTCALLVQQKHGVTLIPTAGVQRTTNNTYVYLVKPTTR